MSDQYDDNDIDDEEDEDERSPAWYRKDMKRQQKAAATAAAEAAQAKRELALLRAGIDTSTALGKMFADGYKGDLTPEAVGAAWSAVVPATTPSTSTQENPPVNSDVPPQHQLQQQQAAALRDGAPLSAITPPPNTRTPLDEARQVMTRTGSHEEATGAWLRAQREHFKAMLG